MDIFIGRIHLGGDLRRIAREHFSNFGEIRLCWTESQLSFGFAYVSVHPRIFASGESVEHRGRDHRDHIIPLAIGVKS